MSQINAENLTISIPGTHCNKSCPYCISKITPDVSFNDLLYMRNLKKVKEFARIANVSSVLITGKGEPTLNKKFLEIVAREMNNFPLELQTNGLVFNKPNWNHFLYDIGFNNISISLDFIKEYPEDTLKRIKIFFDDNSRMADMTIRLAINITDHVPEEYLDINFYVDLCSQYNVSQIIFRNIVNPGYINHKNKYSDWINDNTKMKKYFEILNSFLKIVNKGDAYIIRNTKFGMSVYDYKGLSIALSNYCIQETNNTNDIRSLIYQVDGHLYMSWNSKASRIF